MAFPKPTDLKSLKVEMKVKPDTDADSLLMYCSQTHEGHGDYTSLSIRNKRLEFQYDTGSGPAVIRSKKEIAEGEWITITIERNHQDGVLNIDGKDISRGKSLGTTLGLNLKIPLYIGGVDKHRIKIHPNVGVETGFSGCVSEVRFENSENLLIHN